MKLVEIRDGFNGRHLYMHFCISRAEARKAKMAKLPSRMAWFDPLVCSGCKQKIYGLRSTTTIAMGIPRTFCSFLFTKFKKESIQGTDLYIQGILHGCGAPIMSSTFEIKPKKEMVIRPGAEWYKIFD